MLVPRRVFFVWSWTARENITILQRQLRFLGKNYRSKSCSVFCRIAEQINYFQVIFVVLSNQKRENVVLSEVVSLLGLNSMVLKENQRLSAISRGEFSTGFMLSSPGMIIWSALWDDLNGVFAERIHFPE